MALFHRKFPLVLQHDSRQCGIACVAMVCACHGIRYGLAQLSEICTPTSHGVSLRGISDLACRLGLEKKAAKFTLGQLRHERLPMVLHWRQNHFVLLYRVRGDRFYVADPAKGLVTYSAAEMEEAWGSVPPGYPGGQRRGIAVSLWPGESFGCLAPEEAPRRPLSFLARYIRKYRRHLGRLVALLALASLLQLALPFLTQNIVDVGIRDKNLGIIWMILMGELVIVGARAAAEFIRRRLVIRISTRINTSMVSDFFSTLLHLPMSFFDSRLTGDLLQRLSDHRRIQEFLTSQMLGIMFSAITFSVFGAVLAVYDIRIFLVFIVGTLLYAGWMAFFMERRKVLDYELFEKQSRAQALTYRFITSMQEIKLQSCGRRRRSEWEEGQRALLGVELRAQNLRQSQESGGIFIEEMKNIVITVIAARAVISGDITLGAMMAVQYMVGQLNAPVAQIMDFIYRVQDVGLSLERVREIHLTPGKEDLPSEERLREFAPSPIALSIRDLSFKYDRHNPANVINNVSFDIPRGRTTAIVGASGCGKSTLLKLMLGYYAPVSGEILLFGRPLEEYGMGWWRRQCGVVMQDGVIFSESIARNIAVQDGPVDYARVRAAAAMARIDEFVQALPLKYETAIGADGMSLSNGQRQRILIARAVYKDPEFIIFDEATNSLDAHNERGIVDSLSSFFKNRTVVIVAHRLSTVRDADNIIVIDKGGIVESGTHERLIEMRGAYYDLVREQLDLGT